MAPVSATWPARGYFWRLCCLVSPFHAIHRETQRYLALFARCDDLATLQCPAYRSARRSIEGPFTRAVRVPKSQHHRNEKLNLTLCHGRGYL